MKSVLYPGILGESNLTATDKIVYSQILYRSLWDNSTSFTVDGNFSISEYTDYSDGYVPLSWSATSYIHYTVNISERQFFRSKKNLIDYGYMDSESIKLLDGITDTFFTLKTDTGLSGLRLIVYSYLADKTEKYGWVDKYRDAMAKELHLSENVLVNCLTYLHNAGFIERKRKVRQILIRAVNF